MGGFFTRRLGGSNAGGPGQPQRPRGGGPPVDPNNPNNTGVVIPGFIDRGTWANSGPTGGPTGGGAASPFQQGRPPGAGLSSPDARGGPSFGGQLIDRSPAGASVASPGYKPPTGDIGGTSAPLPPMGESVGKPVDSGAGGGAMFDVMPPPQTGFDKNVPPQSGAGPLPGPAPQPPDKGGMPGKPWGGDTLTRAQTGRRRALQRMY